MICVVAFERCAVHRFGLDEEAKLMTYVSRGPPQPATAKKAVRWPVAIPITASGSGLGHHAAELWDLSRTGCLIQIQCKFAPNDLVLITMPSFGPRGARVVWSSGVETGLRFLDPLSLTVLETIATRHRREGSIDF